MKGENIMKIFISGSAGFGNKSTLDTLPNNVKTVLDDIIAKKHKILIGDCQGIDTLVQSYLKKNNYKNVEIYFSKYCRNCIDPDWTKHNIPVGNAYGRAMHGIKDLQMAKDADAAIALWNNESKGTEQNIKNMQNQNKPVFIYDINTKTWVDDISL